MFNNKFLYFLFILIIVSLNQKALQIMAMKCTAKGSANYYSCSSVYNLRGILLLVEPSWRGIAVINEEVDVLDFTADPGMEQEQLKLSQITSLDLSRCGNLYIDTDNGDGFAVFTSLERLNLTETHIEELKPGYFASNNNTNKSNLKYLDVSANELATLEPNAFQGLTQLKSVNFSRNNIKSIAAGTFATLKHLEFIHLGNNSLTNASIGCGAGGGCDALNKLILSVNDIKELSTFDFIGLPQLQYLSLHTNSMHTIANGTFAPLTNLTLLNLSRNSLRNISAEMFGSGGNGGLEATTLALQELYLTSNDLSHLDAQAFQALQNLQILHLAHNHLEHLPAQLFQPLHAHLRKLYLYNNDLSTIVANTFSNLNSLELLHLDDNHIKKLDANIFGTTALANLRSLSLASNGLEHMHPLALSFLPSLQYLSLSKNKLTTLEVRHFQALHSLRSLFLSNNLIEEIPADFLHHGSPLSGLMVLTLSYNKLSFMPPMPATRVLPSLRKFKLEGNPWQCNCLDEFFDWLHRNNVEYFTPKTTYYRKPGRPLCVVTDELSVGCMRNTSAIEERGYSKLFESALRSKK